MLFFETFENVSRKPFKRRSDLVQWKYQNKPCYLENRVVREPCKRRTACIANRSNMPRKVHTHHDCLNLLKYVVGQILELTFKQMCTKSI